MPIIKKWGNYPQLYERARMCVCVCVHIWLCLWSCLLYSHVLKKVCLIVCVLLGEFAFVHLFGMCRCLSISLHASVCLCVLMNVCVHVWPLCVCVFCEPLPTITVSVHYSLWPAKIIINREQRWTEGNERLVGGAAEARFVLLDKWQQHFTFCHWPLINHIKFIISWYLSTWNQKLIHFFIKSTLKMLHNTMCTV